MSTNGNCREGQTPMLEALEPRQLLSASLSHGTLNIVGTNGNDQIKVSLQPVKNAAKNDRIVVEINKRRSTFLARAVSLIAIDGLKGRDTINVSSLPAVAGKLRSVKGSGSSILLGAAARFRVAAKPANTASSANTAPVLAGVNNFTAITEDQTTNAGDLVSTLISGKVTDVDTGAVNGIALTGLNSSTGTWQYSLDGGGTWNAVGTVAGNSALLLRSADRLRFVPDGLNGTTAAVTFRAWDQTSGTPGTRADTTSSGGTTAFSTATATANITVTSVNDAPTISNGATVTLAGTNENTTSSVTTAGTILTSASWADVDTGALKGIAITGKTGNGSWQYSTDGVTWCGFGAVSAGNALLIASTTRVRYVPDGLNGETAAFTFVAWDQTTGTASTNGTPGYANPGSGGGTSAYSSQTATASMAIASVNDAPVLAGANNFTAITEDQTTNAGDPVSTLISGKVTDVDTGAVNGIALTGLNSSTGTWQYSLDGGGAWNAVGTVAGNSALLLRSADRLRFVPDGLNGTTAAVTFRAWDQTSGAPGTRADATASGGTTAFSTATATANITVTSVNDASGGSMNNYSSQFLTALDSSIYAHDVGAVGDGIVDDAPALQAAINTAPAGDTLVLDAGKTYRLGKGLVIQNNVNLEGNGATLLLDTSAWPDNEVVMIQSPLSDQAFTWTAPVKAGQTTFPVAAPLAQVPPGTIVFMQLGQDPNDPYEEHWARMVKVIANTGSTITIDTPVPYDIIQGQFVNRLCVARTYVQNVTVHNVRFDYTTRATPDADIWIDRAANVTIDTISGRFSIAAQASDSQNVTIRNVTGQLTHPHCAAGRVLTAWQSENVSLSNVSVTSDSLAPAVFLESWAHNTTVTNLAIDYQTATGSIGDVFHLTGGSFGTSLDKISIHSLVPTVLVDSGGQNSTYHFGDVTMTGGSLIAAPLGLIDRFDDNGRVYANATSLDVTITLKAGVSDYYVPLFRGTVKSATAILSGSQGVKALYLINDQDSGANIGNIPTGQVVNLNGVSYIGSDYPFNDPADPTKSLHIYTGANLPPGATITFHFEYYAA
ncbi:MAG: hypothetical protein ACHRHE_01220 [Tepidisphaerales bacterium]